MCEMELCMDLPVSGNIWCEMHLFEMFMYVCGGNVIVHFLSFYLRRFLIARFVDAHSCRWGAAAHWSAAPQDHGQATGSEQWSGYEQLTLSLY